VRADGNLRHQDTVKNDCRRVKNSYAALPAWLRPAVMDPMVENTAVFCAVPSALERYGAGWDDEPPSRMPISA
jgi:hypothetical protein